MASLTLSSNSNENLLAKRRSRVASFLGLSDEILIVSAGQPVPLPEESDQTYPFIAHSEYYYLSEDSSPGGVVAFDPRLGAVDGWFHFVPEVTEAERVWEGKLQAPGIPLREFDGWLDSRTGRPLVALGAPLRRAGVDETRTHELRSLLTDARRAKEDGEIDLVRRAAKATAEGYARVAEILAPGLTESQVQIELEAAFYRGGADQTGFATIVGTGRNSAVLHFSPSQRRIEDGDFVLIDSGAQVGRYTADVTRTTLVGKRNAFKTDLYQVVLAAQEKAIARCKAGIEWKDVHIACAVDLTAGLVSMGIMKGNPQQLFEQEAHALFFPHGLGHMVGLGVRDGSGLAPGRTRDPRPCLSSLRMDLPLKPGYLVTVEPGLYFIPPLLCDGRRRAKYRQCVNWELIDQYLDVGGVRIEDDVLVTDGRPEVLTAVIPK